MLPAQRGKGGDDDSDPAGQAPKQNSANSEHERLRESKPDPNTGAEKCQNAHQAQRAKPETIGAQETKSEHARPPAYLAGPSCHGTQ